MVKSNVDTSHISISHIHVILQKILICLTAIHTILFTQWGFFSWASCFTLTFFRSIILNVEYQKAA